MTQTTQSREEKQAHSLMKAEQTFTNNRIAANRAITKIRAALEKSAAKDAPKNWADAGSMGHIAESLEDLVEFLNA